MRCDIRIIGMISFLLVIAEGRQRHFVFLTADLILRPDILHTVRMSEILILVLSSRTKLLNHISYSRVYPPKHNLFTLLHTNFCVVIDALYTDSQFAVTKLTMTYCFANECYEISLNQLLELISNC